MWAGGVDETKTLKKMNQILTILLRNVSLSVIVKEVKQGNRFGQPSPRCLAARLLHAAASIPAKTRNDGKKAFWSHSGHVAQKSVCTTTMRGERGSSGLFLAVMANSVGSLTTTPKQTICHSPMFEWYTICMWTKHACHGAAVAEIMVITLVDPHIISEWRDKQHVLVPTLCAQIVNIFQRPLRLSSNGLTANDFVNTFVPTR